MNVKEINILLKTIKLINKQRKSSTEKLQCYFEYPMLHFISKDVKTRIGSVKERVIQMQVDSELDVKMTPVMEFKTTAKTIKDICTNRFIFDDADKARVYLVWGQDDMHKNVIYTELNNRMNELNSSLTLPLGDITMDKMDEPMDIILDFDRLKALNPFNCDDVVVQFMSNKILVSESQINGKDGIFTKLIVYSSIRKS